VGQARQRKTLVLEDLGLHQEFAVENELHLFIKTELQLCQNDVIGLRGVHGSGGQFSI